jgi:hypothetical protein
MRFGIAFGIAKATVRPRPHLGGLERRLRAAEPAEHPLQQLGRPRVHLRRAPPRLSVAVPACQPAEVGGSSSGKPR